MMKMGPHSSFPELVDKLAAAKVAGDYLVNSKVFLPVGDRHELAGFSAKNVI